MKFLKAISDILTKVVNIITSTMVAVTVIIIAMGVFVRYVLGGSLPYVFELSSLLYAYIIFWGLSLSLKDNAMIGVDVLTSRLGPKGQKVSTAFTLIVIIAISAVMVSAGFDLVARTHMRLTALNISQKYLYLSLPVGFLVLGINALIKLIYVIFNGGEAKV